MGTTLHYRSAYHPQTERTIHTLEDLLRLCMLDFGGSWEEHLALVEFSYNNSYQDSIQMAPFEALYGRACRTPTCWDEVGVRQLLGPELIAQTNEKVQVVRQHLKAAQDRQRC